MLLRNRRGSRMIELNVKAPQMTPKNKKIKLFSPLRVHFTALFPKFFLKKETFLKPPFKFSFLQALLYNLLDFLPEVLAYLAHTDIFSYRHHNADSFLSFSFFAEIPVLNML